MTDPRPTQSEKQDKFKRTQLAYREIQTNLEKGRLEKRGLDIVHDAIPQVEQTYKEVERSHEAVMDSIVIAEMSSITAQETRQYELESATSFNIDNFVQCLSTFLDTPQTEGDSDGLLQSTYAPSNGLSGLCNLGGLLYQTSLRPPTSDHMVGPLSVERKVRHIGPRASRIIDSAGESAATELQLNDIQQGKKMTQIIKQIYDLLIEQGATEEEPVGLFEFVLNPQSFSQSVENLFYLSFLVHDDKVSLDLDEANVPVISVLSPLPTDPTAKEREERRRALLPSTQMIFDLEYKTWRELCDAFEINESVIPHRVPEQPRTVDPSNPQWYT